VGALSFVREDVPDWSVWGGIPAKRVGTRGKDLLRFETPLAEK